MPKTLVKGEEIVAVERQSKRISSELVTAVRTNGLDFERVVDIKEQISKIESIDAADLILRTQIIKSARSNFYIAHVLKKIYDGKLYRGVYNPETKEYFTSMEAYVKNTYSISRMTANNYLSVAKNINIDIDDKLVDLGIYKLILLSRLNISIEAIKPYILADYDNMYAMSSKRFFYEVKKIAEIKGLVKTETKQTELHAPRPKFIRKTIKERYLRKLQENRFSPQEKEEIIAGLQDAKKDIDALLREFKKIKN